MAAWKRHFYQGLVAAPALFIGGLGIWARIQEPSFPTPGLTELEQTRINSFREAVLASQVMVRSRYSMGETIDALKIFEKGLADNRFQSMPSDPYRLVSDYPAKRQILESRDFVVRGVSFLAHYHDGLGDHEGAAKLLARAIRLLEVGKYSEYQTLFTSSSFQRIRLRQLAKVLKKTSTATHAQCYQMLTSLSQPHYLLHAMRKRQEALYKTARKEREQMLAAWAESEEGPTQQIGETVAFASLDKGFHLKDLRVIHEEFVWIGDRQATRFQAELASLKQKGPETFVSEPRGLSICVSDLPIRTVRLQDELK